MPAAAMRPTRCAICRTEENATELYPATFDHFSFNAANFSARRVPDGVHYRIVKCRSCGLVRSDPVLDACALAKLYAQSSFEYGGEADHIRATYGRYLAKIAPCRTSKGALLEIGCGNGFFLEEAFSQGYHPVQGIESSRLAVESASPAIRDKIICAAMRPGIFNPEQFEIICLFQVIDHLPEPGVILEECYKLLLPGGIVLVISHNIEALSAKLLKSRSPIIDIEHTYLFSPATLARLLIAHGFQVVNSGSVRNTYPLHYLTKMAPLPKGLKRALLSLLRVTHGGRLRLSLPLGNLYIAAQKPACAGVQ
jgi:SAM-dependent methyltransferase